MTEHIDPGLSLALLALDASDPERKAALAHAAACPACRRVLEESAELLSRLDESETPEVVSLALKRRIETAVFRAPSVRSQLWRALLPLVLALSLVLSLVDGDFSGPLLARLGVHCLAYEAGFGLGPLPLFVLLARGRSLRAAPGWLALATASLAFCGQLLLRTRCEAEGAGAHLLAFHFGGVVLCAALGALSGHYLRAQPAR